jgi:uncharacterized membrane protein YraQ (UPF0718 family)
MTLMSEPTSIFDRARKMDRVVLAILALLAALFVLVPAQAPVSLRFAADALVFIAPFLMISVLVAAFARASGMDKQIAIAFSGHPIRAVVLAALFGALSPFCSCGVVPIIAALLVAGVPLAPVMAFWIASPLMDPEMFVIMLPVFGLEFTIAKLLAAVGIGLGAGLATHAMVRAGMFADPLAQIGAAGVSACSPSVLTTEKIVWRFWEDDGRRAAFAAEGQATGWFLFKWLSLAFLLESLMVAYLPAETVGTWLSGDNWWSIPASVLVGVPAYLNGYAAIPTVDALIDMGMAPGAGLAFMIAGGVTSIPAAMAVYPLVKRPVFVWYVAAGLGGSMLAAYGFQAYLVAIA